MLFSFAKISILGTLARLITDSGNSLSSWGWSDNPEYSKGSYKIGKHFNCPTKNSTEMIECLQKVKAYDLLSYSPYNVIKKFTNLQWSPTLEPNVTGALLVQTPMEMLKSGQMLRIPWMTALMENEGLVFTTCKGYL